MLNSKHARASPSQTPFLMGKGSDSVDWILICYCVFLIVIVTRLVSFLGICISSIAGYSLVLSIISYTALKSSAFQFPLLTLFKYLVYIKNLLRCGPSLMEPTLIVTTILST